MWNDLVPHSRAVVSSQRRSMADKTTEKALQSIENEDEFEEFEMEGDLIDPFAPV